MTLRMARHRVLHRAGLILGLLFLQTAQAVQHLNPLDSRRPPEGQAVEDDGAADEDERLSIAFGVGYDGDAHRSGPLQRDLEISYRFARNWQLNAGEELYSGMGRVNHVADQSRTSMELEFTAGDTEDSDWDVKLALEIAGPGLATRRGVDVIPSATVRYAATEALSMSATLGDWISTSRGGGGRSQSVFAQIAGEWSTGWPFSEDDGFWGAFVAETSDQVLVHTLHTAIELGYAAQWRKNTSLVLGLGRDLTTPYAKHGVFFRASIQWRL